MQPYIPTAEQIRQCDAVVKQGYRMHSGLSASTCTLVMSKDNDVWVFDFEGGINHGSVDDLKSGKLSQPVKTH